MSRDFDMTTPAGRERGLSAATDEIADGALVVVPTDTTYGIGCDAFSRTAVARMRRARGSSRATPPPVLVPHVRTMDGIATGVSADVRALAEAFWPGALTLICRAQPTLDWDLGDGGGTVSIRMPLHPVALELLERTGPLAVVSANLVGALPPVTCDQARQQFADSVDVYLDAGPSTTGVPSTVVDGTGDVPRVLRLGAIGLDDLRSVVPDLAGLEGDTFST